MDVRHLIELLATYEPTLMVCVPDGGEVDYREVLSLELKRIYMIDEDEGSDMPHDCLVLDG